MEDVVLAWHRSTVDSGQRKHPFSVQDEVQNAALSSALLESRNEETNIAGGALGDADARRDDAGHEVGVRFICPREFDDNGEGGAWRHGKFNYGLRVADLSRGSRKDGRPGSPLPGPHDEAFYGPRNRERGVLDGARRTGQKQHLFLHSGASEPGSGSSELESLSGRSGVEEGEGEIGREWQIGREG